jgi:UDP-N-acetylmuramoyl-tripeptide--D-alanyl-D-alanine ligase
VKAFRGRLLKFGIDADADVRASAVADAGIAGTRATVVTRQGEVELATPLVGRANLANVLAAAAVALAFDVPLADIAAIAATLRPAAHRGEIVRLARGITVIDDSYNANPAATKRAVGVLAAAQAPRRVAILGEMLELGDHSLALHEDVGRAVAAARIDQLLTIGGAAARALADSAERAGMTARVRHYPTSDEAADAAVATIADEDLVLVKGSRGVRTDRVVERLKDAFAEHG